MLEGMDQFMSFNFLSLLLAIVIIVSVLQGMMKGASGSARHLFFFVMEGGITAVGVLAAWQIAEWASPQIRELIQKLNIQIPPDPISAFQQMYYTFVTGVRDFRLFRYALLFIIAFFAVKQLIYLLWHILASYLGSRLIKPNPSGRFPGRFPLLSGLAGGAIGSVLGTTRALLLIAVLFAYVTLTPNGPLTNYIKESKVYQQGTTQIIEPFTGEFIHERLPIFTQAVEDQINEILQRRYEIIDRNIPDNIAAAAQAIVAGKQTDLEKARALYDWVGSRVKYDNEKVSLYEDKQVWKEQTPEDTYRSKKGVCIDYSRLYAIMARSVGLQVKVVTGLGYDGRSSYGPHAWNEVYISGQEKWIPLDTTWAASGANWFDPPRFYDTHIKDA